METLIFVSERIVYIESILECRVGDGTHRKYADESLELRKVVHAGKRLQWDGHTPDDETIR